MTRTVQAVVFAGILMTGFNMSAHAVRMVRAVVRGDQREADLQGHFAAVDGTDFGLLMWLFQRRSKKETR